MKPENTIENKSKFFGHYIGQEVHCRTIYYKSGTEETFGPNFIDVFTDVFGMPVDKFYDKGYPEVEYVRDYLLLRSLSSLSNKEATNMGLSGFTRKVKDYINVLSQYEADVLRANGFAIHWQGLLVEELLERNWIKIKE